MRRLLRPALAGTHRPLGPATGTRRPLGPALAGLAAAVLAPACVPPSWGADALLHSYRRPLETTPPPS
ncbi:MAG TPA: hypothetical protein VG389_07855 [Myxococcota bacterium]|nr:hypothetical protein [Myxococcota bacterium]